MGKLRSPHSPPSRSAPSAFPRMDPPPPYEASSRSSSAHSNDPLQTEESAPPQQRSQQSTTLPQSQPPEEQPSPEADTQDHERKTEEGGCLTFGEGASGCMVVGKNAEGCMNYGDNTSGWYVRPMPAPSPSARSGGWTGEREMVIKEIPFAVAILGSLLNASTLANPGTPILEVNSVDGLFIIHSSLRVSPSATNISVSQHELQVEGRMSAFRGNQWRVSQARGSRVLARA
jgi:hypothetical protein